MLEESQHHCPYCGEPISLLLDLSGGDQTYIEDCEVCCRPITVQLQVSGEDYQCLLGHENDT